MKKLLAVILTVGIAGCTHQPHDSITTKNDQPKKQRNTYNQCLQYGFKDGSEELDKCMKAEKIPDSAPANVAKPGK